MRKKCMSRAGHCTWHKVNVELMAVVIIIAGISCDSYLRLRPVLLSSI